MSNIMANISLSLFLIIMTCLPSPSYSQINLNNGLLAYYPFNGNANDTSGNGLHGTVIGATPTTDRFNYNCSAYEFDGIDDYIDLGDRPAFRFTTDFSFSLWIWFPGGDQDAGLLFKRDNQPPFSQYNLAVSRMSCCWVGNPDNFLSSLIRHDQSYNDKTIVGQNDTLIHGWNHIVWQNDISDRCNLYLNNALVTSSSINTGSINIPGFPLLVGTKTLIDGFYRGKIDDIRIYNRMLSLPEIDSLYREQVVPVAPCGIVLPQEHVQLDAVYAENEIHFSWGELADLNLQEGFLLSTSSAASQDTIAMLSFWELQAGSYTYSVKTTGSFVYQLVAHKTSGELLSSNPVQLEIPEIPILIYPNPVSDRLYIRFSTQTPPVIQLFNINSTEITNIPTENREGILWLDLSSLPRGIFYLHWENGKSLGVEKIIKK